MFPGLPPQSLAESPLPEVGSVLVRLVVAHTGPGLKRQT